VPSGAVSGTWTDPRTSATGAVTGTFTPQRFAVEKGVLVARGVLNATFTDASGAVVKTAKATPVALPVQTSGTSSSSARTSALGDASALAVQPVAACDVLNLLLGPLDLNLLGLRVQLNQVDLDITAVPGAGNLLGNLLCAVAGLLDGAGALAQIAGLLNQILGILNGLGGTAGALRA
jgi:hypothetical protein